MVFRMPFAPKSTAIASVKAAMPYFVAQYTVRWRPPIKPIFEMIDPRIPCLTIRRTVAGHPGASG